jgi:hypothetical protein
VSVLRLITIIGTLVAALAVRAAQPVSGPPLAPAAAAPVADGPPSLSGLAPTHGWFVREVAPRRNDEKPRWQVYHVPPRRAVLSLDGLAHGSSDGSFRVSAPLAERPNALAAWRDRVWLIFDAKPAGKDSATDGSRQVLTLAVTEILPGRWRDEPAERPRLEPGLPGMGRLTGFVGTAVGPAALVENIGMPAERWSLRVLEDRVWKPLAIPPAAAELSILRLVPDPDGLTILGVTSTGLEWWRGTPPTARGSDPEPPGWLWRRAQRLLATDGQLTTAEAAVAIPFLWRGHLAFVAPSRENASWTHARVVLLDAVTPRLLTTLALADARPIPDPTDPINAPSPSAVRLGVVPMLGLDRLALVWDAPAPPPPAGTRPGAYHAAAERLGVAEISLNSGRTLWLGPADMDGPIRARDLVLLVAFMVMGVASLLMFVLRTESAPEPHLPGGYAVADPSRRVVATLIDAAIAAVIASRFLDIPFGRAFSSEGIASLESLHLLMGTTLAAFLTTAAGDVLMARSIGKALMGCVIIQAPAPEGDAQARAASPLQAIARAALKWGLPPLAALTIMEPAGRHRAEVLTRTAVVMPIRESGSDHPDQ